MCWGDSDRGGNCAELDLTGITAVYSNGYAFAALRNLYCEDWCSNEFSDREAMCTDRYQCQGCAECAAPSPDSRCALQLLGLLVALCADRC